MTELRNLEQDIDRFRGRVLAAAVLVLLAFGLLVARLVHLQVFRHEELATQAEANRIAVVPVVPSRGLIVDRNGVVVATNLAAYTLEISTPRSRQGDLEQLIQELGTVVDIGPRDRRRYKRLQDELKGADSLPIRTRMSDEDVARFTAQRYRFPGVEIKARLYRNYPMGEVGSHLLGYIGRINQSEKKDMEEWDEADQGNYRGTEYIGKLGLEQSYERQLHGTAGFEEVETSAGGRAVRRISRTPASSGHKLVLTVDIKLQALVEELFGSRRGALVALDPRNGEVLAFVSKPAFDPNLFVDGIDIDSWRELNESIDRPLLNRALKGTYPPGSTFKPFMAMAALDSGKRDAGTVINDGGTYVFAGHTFRSHGDKGLGPVDMNKAIVKSSNVYFYSLANEMGVDLMFEQLSKFGLGQKSGLDLEGEVTGILPSTAWKRRYYKKPEQQRWYGGETISLGIGQGYNNFTMLQMAQATAILVSGGQRFKPHLVQAIEAGGQSRQAELPETKLPPVPYKPEHAEVIRRALQGVTQEGTSTRVFLGAGYTSGGKTGTAQAVTIRQNQRYDASKLEEHQRDHSLYIAAAPIDAPTVVLAVVVENAGFGSTAAAPIARRVFDYLLLGQVPSEEDMALTREGKSAAPVGKPRQAVDWIPPGLPSLAGVGPAGAASGATSVLAASAPLPAAVAGAVAGAVADAAKGNLAAAAKTPAAAIAAAHAGNTAAARQPSLSAPLRN